MSSAERGLIRMLITEEIRRLVAAAIEEGGCLPTAWAAALVARAYPGSGMSADDIAGEIVTSAVRARVPVELTRPGPEGAKPA